MCSSLKKLFFPGYSGFARSLQMSRLIFSRDHLRNNCCWGGGVRGRSLKETEVQQRRGTTSPDPEKNPDLLRGPLGGFPVGIPRE